MPRKHTPAENENASRGREKQTAMMIAPKSTPSPGTGKVRDAAS